MQDQSPDIPSDASGHNSTVEELNDSAMDEKWMIAMWRHSDVCQERGRVRPDSPGGVISFTPECGSTVRWW